MSKFVGTEILPGVVFHVSKDVKPATIEALKELAAAVSIKLSTNLIKVNGKSCEIVCKEFITPKGVEKRQAVRIAKNAIPVFIVAERKS